jgi:SAM-dependent methyltransferase
MTDVFARALVDAASAPYRSAGRFAWHFSRSKLKRDPVFFGLLEHGVIPDAQCLVDLGCGQGLLASWLRSARTLHDTGHWRQDWPAPPRLQRILGVDLMPRDIDRARRALVDQGDFKVGDLRTADLGHAEVIVILDALHYIDYREQRAVLARIRDALPPGGVFVTRIGNAAGGLRFRASQWVDRVVTFARGHRLSRLHCRSTADWTSLLVQLGFRVETLPMSGRTPFANVLLVARVDPAASPAPRDPDSVC